MERLLALAKQAASRLPTSTPQQRCKFIQTTADLLIERCDLVVQANAADLAAAPQLTAALRDRLLLDAPRVHALAVATRQIAELPEVLGALVSSSERPNGLRVDRQRVPLGVIGIVYEARPNVTVDAALLAIKAGNAVILRGGTEARLTNAALASVVRDALTAAGLPADAMQIPALLDRALVDALVGRAGGLDLAIPRGGTALIEAVSKAARVPVIQHYQGVCHIYVDCDADLPMAIAIVLNAKVARPGVCNAMEALLIDSAVAAQATPLLIAALTAAGVQVHGCGRTRALVGDLVVAATPADYGKEYLDLECLCAIVDGVQGACDHIARYGSRHTEAIVTNNPQTAEQFIAGVDASCVAVNASTRFNDGGCLGLGAEIGISTTKIHAYGPMGLEALTAVRFVVRGQGQVRT